MIEIVLSVEFLVNYICQIYIFLTYLLCGQFGLCFMIFFVVIWSKLFMFINILFLGNACSQVTQLRNSFILSRQFKNKAKTQTESLKFVLLCFRKTFCFGSKYFPSGTPDFVPTCFSQSFLGSSQLFLKDCRNSCTGVQNTVLVQLLVKITQ